MLSLVWLDFFSSNTGYSGGHNLFLRDFAFFVVFYGGRGEKGARVGADSRLCLQWKLLMLNRIGLCTALT
jgi:hypothetical protein